LVLYLGIPAPAPEAAQARPGPDAGRMPTAALDEGDMPIMVSGRVLDPQGNPFAGAKLYVGFSTRGFAREVPFGGMTFPRRTTSAADGRFHFTFTRSELDAPSLDHARPAVIAVAEKYGTAWADIKE